MFHIIQSNSTHHLARRLAEYYQTDERSLFEPFLVIVPAKVLEAWLVREVAKKVGVASLLTAKFWGQYQWQLIDKVIKVDNQRLLAKDPKAKPSTVPKEALLSGSVMRWRLFEFLHQKHLQQAFKDDTHPLYFFGEQKHIKDLWQMAQELAKVYVGYLIERNDWLMLWAQGRRVDVALMIAKKDASLAYFGSEESTPDWQKNNYIALEAVLGYLWQHLFAEVYLERVALEERFWQVLADTPNAKQQLPGRVYLFTVQQLPKIELDFLQRLSGYTEVVLLHFNPSMMFWADIVDKSWLQTQQVIKPQSVYLKDYGHGLLSQLGKASRETFAMLAEMSGSVLTDEFSVMWQDEFVVTQNQTTLLHALQSDILMLDEHALPSGVDEFSDEWLKQKDKTSSFVLRKEDTSLSVHNCHSLKRELEVARILIGQWLNADPRRRLSEVAIMLPEVSEHHELIASVFGAGRGLDGLYLPATITGVADEAVNQLWRGIFEVYHLPATRFYYAKFCEWLMMEPVYVSFGLSFAMAQRACQLLSTASFVRGLDEEHLAQHLHKKDKDYQRTFAYALDRLMLSLAIDEPFSSMLYSDKQATVMVSGVRDDDAPIIEALCRMYQAFAGQRGSYQEHSPIVQPIERWLRQIEEQVIDRYFYRYKGTPTLNSIFGVMNSMKASLWAHDGTLDNHHISPATLSLPLAFVLDSLDDNIASTQVASKPAGNITIGRFGSLRGIGFGFILMLGMDLSAFPRTVSTSGFDLSVAGLPRRGDRVSEDDDKGAFLEAILQASEACAIFYSGQRPSGEVEGLPAMPVAELMRFISYANCQDEEGNLLSADDIKRHLITDHEAMPFSADRFGAHRLLPPLWQQVADDLTHNRKQSAVVEMMAGDEWSSFIDCLIDDDDIDSLALMNHFAIMNQLPSRLDITQLATALRKPARAYLKGKRPELLMPDEPDEPLLLDSLQQYALGRHLQHNSPDEVLRYGGYLPAGAAGEFTLTHSKDEYKKWLDNLEDQLQQKPCISATAPILTPIHLAGRQVVLQSMAPTDPMTTGTWLSLGAGKTDGADDKLLYGFLSHLCWQCSLGDTPADSFWYYQSKHKDRPPTSGHLQRFASLDADKCHQILQRFLLVYACIQRFPVVLSTNHAVQLLKAGGDKTTNDDELKKALKKHWLAAKPYGKQAYVSEDSHHHPNWQYILEGTDPLDAIKPFVRLAGWLYQDFFKLITTKTQES